MPTGREGTCDLKAKLLQDPTVKAEYDALEGEFMLAGAVIGARVHAGLNQEQLAKRSSISLERLIMIEGGGISTRLDELQRISEATGTLLKVSFEHHV